ncbi:MAG: ATP-dependent Clp protease adaptor ClpS [Planctomycetia bacterium]|nr:ATP-dependent Clp protease adaptor ClpS [Planctomycetia bacterium]
MEEITVAVTATAEPLRETRRRPRRQPRYHVVLWNDDDHTFQYVIAMLKQLFGHAPEAGLKLAREVDAKGRVVVLTTTKEHAELKRDQIHAFGPDRLIARSKGSMSASIEPEP